MTNLIFKDKVKVTSFQTHLRHLDAQYMYTVQVPYEGKIQWFKFQNIKQKFWKFEDQFDIKYKGQGHQFSSSCETYR